MPEREPRVDEYVGRLSAEQAAIVNRLRDLIRDAAPDAQETFKWAQPVYEHNGPLCYIRAFTRTVNFGFWRGAELDDPAGILGGSGDRMAHVAIRSAAEIDETRFTAFLRQAVQLNAEKGNPTKRRPAGEPA